MEYLDLRYCQKVCGRLWRGIDVYIKLPSLDVLASVFIGDDDDKLRDLAAYHPPVELAHDLLNVGFDLIIRRYFEGSLAIDAQVQHISYPAY